MSIYPRLFSLLKFSMFGPRDYITEAVQKRPRVAVVGAGVIGLSTAVCLSETYGRQLDITVIANKFSPNITSDSAGAVFALGGAYVRDEASRSKCESFIKRHAPVTLDRFVRLHETTPTEDTGLRVARTYKFYKDDHHLPWWGKIEWFNFKALSREEAIALDLPHKDLRTFWSFRTFLVNPTKYLEYLTKRFLEMNGLIVKHKVESLNELQDYDVIVNCTGLGARELVGDTSVYPVSGQIVVVWAPQIKEIYFHREDDLSMSRYVMPRGDGTVMLGGTAEDNNWSTIPDPATERKIIEKCIGLQPAVKEAEVVGGWVGARPVRNSIRLEVENSLSHPPVVHNYGHGGQGVILSWGSAIEATRLVQQCLKERGFSIRGQSKL